MGYNSSNKVLLVDECMNNLIKHSKLEFGRVGAAAVLINNKDIYVIGGYNSDKNMWLKSTEVCFDAFEREDPKWEQRRELNEARYYFGACTA